MRAVLRGAVVACALAWPDVAWAQLPDGPYVAAGGRISVGGEIAATASPPDADAYFNYTDYEHHALRTVRVRILGEWRAAARLSVLGELRIENHDSIEAAALYLRWRPWATRAFSVQVGRIPPVIGSYARHAYGRDNLVIGLPLAYQYLTSLRPDAIPATSDDLLRMRARGWRSSFSFGDRTPASGIPLVTAARWATGAQAQWRVGRAEFAGAVTSGSPSVVPSFRTFDHLSWSGRAGVTAAPGLVLGVSAARGQWLDKALVTAVPETLRGQRTQSVVGVDLEFGLSRVLVRAEWLRSAFEVPVLGHPVLESPLVAEAGFIEGRYRWHPRWQTAARFERLTFSEIQGTFFDGALTPWDAPVIRVEAILGYRMARNLEIRAGWQYNHRDAGRVTTRSYPALQVLYWY